MSELVRSGIQEKILGIQNAKIVKRKQEQEEKLRQQEEERRQLKEQQILLNRKLDQEEDERRREFNEERERLFQEMMSRQIKEDKNEFVRRFIKACEQYLFLEKEDLLSFNVEELHDLDALLLRRRKWYHVVAVMGQYCAIREDLLEHGVAELPFDEVHAMVAASQKTSVDTRSAEAMA